MLDIRKLRTDLKTTTTELERRGFIFDAAKWEDLEGRRKELQVELERVQGSRNKKSKEIGVAKSAGVDIGEMLSSVENLSDSLKDLNEKLDVVQDSLNDFLMRIPNSPDSSVPAGNSEKENLQVRTFGAEPSFNFKIKDHVEIGEGLGQIDFNSAAKLSGARFVVLTGPIARLQRALIQFMMDVHVREHGYREIYVPFLVNEQTMRGTGQLPKFSDDLFLVNLQELFLIPTAEVPVTGMVRDMILGKDDLPMKYVCHSPCFRSEAGSYGKDTRGMIRQHQFEKVELVQIVKPEESGQALEELTKNAEVILQRLELPYRVVELCAGDLGFSASKTYDLEVWLPYQQTYREISSCSNFKDFQARRLKARWRNTEGKLEFLHTINGSGLAAGRALVAILENYQQEDGSVAIPTVLQPYMGGKKTISHL